MIKAKYSAAITDKRNDWWNLATGCVAAYQAKGAKSYDASKLNLVGSGLYNLTEVGGSVNWDAAVGWSGFSTLSRCLDTNLSSVINMTWSAIIRVAGVSTNETVMLGCYDGTKQGIYFSYSTSAGWGLYLDSPSQVNSAGSNAAVLAIAYTNAFVNGADVGDFIGQANNTIIRSPYIGAQHYTTPTQYTNGSIQAVAFYTSNISAQIVALTNAMNAL